MGSSTPKQASILVVDDDAATCELLESILTADGYTVRSAASGEAALAAVAQQLPDLILLDLLLPCIDGFEVARRLKADSRSRPVPIILVTILEDRESRLTGLQAGANEFLSKPVDYTELLTRVKNQLKVKEYTDLLAEHNRILEEQVEARTAELRESEARYKRITECLTDYLYTVRIENGRTVESTQSPACVTVTGYTAEEFAANPHLWIQMVVAEDRELVKKQVRQTLAGKEGPSIEHRIIRKNGETRWISNATILHKDASGKLLSYDGVIKDITERKLAEQAQARLAAILEATPDFVGLADAKDTHILFINKAGRKMTGLSEDEDIAKLKIADVHPEWANKMFNDEIIPVAIRDGKWVGDCAFLNRSNGRETPVTMVLLSHKTPSGEVEIFSTISRDITERKQAEATIEHANRALATLSAVNRSLVHATDEVELLQTICQAVVEQRDYRMSCVGYVQHDVSKSIKIMARAGHDEGYLDVTQLTWAETERGMGPSGRAVRSGMTQLCQDMANDPCCLPWHDAARQHGYAASIALPLLNRDNTVFGILHVYAAEANAFTPNEIDLLEQMAGDLAFGVHTLHIRHERDLALVKNQEQLVQLQDSLKDTMLAIARIVEMRDPYTAGHQVRVADLAAAIARQMELPEEQVHAIHLAGTVHDLGKIQIPAEILSKPGKISDAEFTLIKVHPQAGYDILKDIDFPWPLAQMVLQHHERMDGSGYPQGLKGDAILLEARILSVADVVEAMSAHRPYRPGLGIEVALAEITKQRGVYYDSRVVDACLALFREHGYQLSS